jgi:hypothetical protein
MGEAAQQYSAQFSSEVSASGIGEAVLARLAHAGG